MRGFAILGILLLNIRDFSMLEGAYALPASYHHFDTLSDRVAWAAGEILWSRKFYPMLALLFGAGIVLMAEGAEAGGRRPAVDHYRRMAGLIAIGMIHGYLIWHGDIMCNYALCGIIAYPFRKLRARTLLILVLLLLTAETALQARSSGSRDDTFYHIDDIPGWAYEEYTTYRGPWAGQLAMRARRSFENQVNGLQYIPQTLALILCGMALVNLGWPAVTRGSRRLRDAAISCCPAAWLVSAMAIGWWAASGFKNGRQWFLMNSWMQLGGIIGMAGYLAAIQWWLGTGHLQRLAAIPAAIGRTALSNYIAQSVMASYIFHGQGLGLFESVGRAGQLVWVLAIWILQILLTCVWLHYFSRGPAEWFLRWISGRRSA